MSEIGPLYEDAAKRIRKHDQKAILFIEPQVRPLISLKVSSVLNMSVLHLTCERTFNLNLAGLKFACLCTDLQGSWQQNKPASAHLRQLCGGLSLLWADKGPPQDHCVFL